MDGLELLRKRAIYRANHRGTKELDIVLGRFANERVPSMDQSELIEFDRLLVLPDPDIEQWIGGCQAPEGVARAVADIRTFLGLDHKNLTPRP